MEIEKKLAEYVLESKFEELPQEAVSVAKTVVLTVVGTTIAGASAEGCEALVNQATDWGGKEEATILIHGGKVPAYNAAFVNGAAARALDFCDGITKGMHVGSSSVPTALAAAELVGGCSGKEFLAALVLGSEVAARINCSSVYDGFDPTGVCSIFATTGIAGRMLRLNSGQMLHALALAFNRAGGSFQSNIDGSLAVRVIQGFVSQAGIICAALAKRGITGPKNFLKGIYGYFHLYAKDKYDPQLVAGELGQRFEIIKTTFKKYPSCKAASASTDAILDLVKETGITADDVARIDIKVRPYQYRLVGHPFEVGDNPRVNAQFNIRYCVASALLRKSCRLEHFDEPFVRSSKVMELTRKIYVAADPALDKRGELAAEVKVRTRENGIYNKTVDIPRGFYGNPLTSEEHMERFQDCVSYARKPLAPENIEKIVTMVSRLEEVRDVRSLIPLLLSQDLRNEQTRSGS
jgi:2-methylcitrate dehydratase PrpD